MSLKKGGISLVLLRIYNRKMIKEKNIRSSPYDDEAPSPKDFLIVFIIVGALIASAWIVYYKFGWLH